MTGGLRFRVCPDCGEMHDKHEWPANHRRPDEVLCAPSVISDVMPTIRSMGNGRLYDSKSEIRKHYKRDGYTELGNDPARNRPFKRQPIDRKGIKDAIERSAAKAARGEYTERGKQIHLTRPGRKAPKHVEPSGPPMPRGAFKPSFA